MEQIYNRVSDDFVNFIELPASRLSGLYGISPMPDKGFGIMAAREIPLNAEVMTCAVKELAASGADIPFSLAQYLFVDPDAYSESEEGTRRYRMVCGDMVFLNHSDWPNCGVSWFRNSEGILFSKLSSNRRIRPGEELTIRYADAPDYRAHGYF